MSTGETSGPAPAPFKTTARLSSRLMASSGFGPLVLLGLTLVVFGDVLLAPRDTVLSQFGRDLSSHFVYARDFGFSQLRAGNLALWNPHIFCGTPALGTFQSALLYPLNWLYLFLPLDKAINADLALHVFLTGLWMYLWTRRRGLHPLARLVAACLLMFGGPVFMKVFAGHLSPLAAMSWAPLLFLAIDGVFERPSPRWCLLGILCIALQILAGHPQTVYYTGVAAALYVALRLVKAPHRGPIVLALLTIYLGGAAIAAVQLMTGLAASSETTRAGGVPYNFAASFSFPAENLLTLVAPGFFGGDTHVAYWGRWYLWEMSLFVGVGGCVLAGYGAMRGKDGGGRTAAVLVVLLVWLALGVHTPLFKLLYFWMPGFNNFRGTSKFLFQASLFLALLAGMGFDTLLKNALTPVAHPPRRLVIVLLTAGVLIGLASFWIRGSATAGASGHWGHLMAMVEATQEPFLAPEKYIDSAFIRDAGNRAASSLLLCGGLCVLLSSLLFLSRFSNKAVYGVALLAIVEVVAFARLNRETFSLAATREPAVQSFLAEHPGDYRILKTPLANSAMSTGAQDIWGYDPILLGRYAEFIAWTQGQKADEATMYVDFSRLHPLYHMLRCRYVVMGEGAALRIGELQNAPPPLPHLLLVRDWAVIKERNAIFAALSTPGFDTSRKVILETEPDLQPTQGKAAGTARVVDASTDHLTIEADLPQPALLVVTDSYSSGWRCLPLAGSVQRQYQVLPANYVLRAIPLMAGRHRLRLEYAPAAFLIGRGISLVALTLYVVALGWYGWTWRRGCYRPKSDEPMGEEL